MAAPLSGGRVGQVRDTGLLVLLLIGTLGLAAVPWWLRAAKEMDAWTGREGEIRRPIRQGVALWVTALAAAGAAALVATQHWPGSTTWSEPLPAATSGVLASIALVAAIAAYSRWLGGALTAWRHFGIDERRRGHQSPLSPRAWLVLHLLPVTAWAAIPLGVHRLQRALNGAWTGTNL